MRRAPQMVAIALLAIAAMPGSAAADRSREGPSMRGGLLGCGGGRHVQADQMENHETRYNLRNFSDRASIAIDRIEVYDAKGNNRCDYPRLDPFPAGFPQSLGPHQTGKLLTEEFGDCHNPVVDLPEDERPLQVLIAWSAEGRKRALPLVVTMIRRVEDASSGQERAQFALDCTALRHR